LTSLPTKIGYLKHLKTLNLQNNQLTSLPSEIGYLSNLQTLNLDGNHLTNLPPEVIEHGTRSTLNYLRVQAEWHLQRSIISRLIGIGILLVIVLGLRWQSRRRYHKTKRKIDTI